MFESYGVHRNLQVLTHSSPTRRASDLLEARSNQGAHLFLSLGLKPGDHIALLLDNNARFFEICWAAQRSGLYYTAISPRLTASERSEEHTSELQSLMRLSYAVFCLKKNKKIIINEHNDIVIAVQ